jgi:AcrR family transcriptional regulator
MALNRPSVYAAFGDKSQLFRRCLRHYLNTHVRLNEALLENHSDWLDGVEAYLRRWAKVFTDPEMPGGCFLASHLGDESLDADIKADLNQLAASTESAITKRLARAFKEGQTKDDIGVAAVARVVLCFLAGMSALARTGTSHRRLSSAISTFMELLRFKSQHN